MSLQPFATWSNHCRDKCRQISLHKRLLMEPWVQSTALNLNSLHPAMSRFEDKLLSACHTLEQYCLDLAVPRSSDDLPVSATLNCNSKPLKICRSHCKDSNLRGSHFSIQYPSAQYFEEHLHIQNCLSN